MGAKETVMKIEKFAEVTGLSPDAFYMYEAALPELNAQAKITWPIAEKAGKHEGFIEGHKIGRREGIDEGLQRAELFMQRNLPINPELNPKWQAFLKEVEKK